MEGDVGEVTGRTEIVRPSALPKDLLPRALSGAVLAVVALAGNWAGYVPFALLVLLVSIVMCWEWSGIVRRAAIDAVLAVHAAVVAVAIGLTVVGLPHWGVLLVLLGTLAVYLSAPRDRARPSALGVIYVGLPAIGLIWRDPVVRLPSGDAGTRRHSAVDRGASWRSRGIRPETRLRRQECERPDPRSWWLPGSDGRRGDGSISGSSARRGARIADAGSIPVVLVLRDKA